MGFLWGLRSAAFYKRMRYQVGASRAKLPFAPLRQYGFSASLGWQFPRSPHLLFLAVENG